MNAEQRLPGSILLSPAGAAATLLMVGNDLWLKRHYAGWWSGKLSDVALCVLLPMFVYAALDWGLWCAARLQWQCRRGWLPLSACLIAAVYYTLEKSWPLATHMHVSMIHFLMPHANARAVTDPSDLICLPFVLLAYWFMRRDQRLKTA